VDRGSDLLNREARPPGDGEADLAKDDPGESANIAAVKRCAVDTDLGRSFLESGASEFLHQEFLKLLVLGEELLQPLTR